MRGTNSDELDVDFGAMTALEFNQFRTLAHEKFGLVLQSGKEQLLSSRLTRKMRELSIPSYADYYRHIVEDQTGNALSGLIDALTTNHTSFFRERAHFDFLRATIVPQVSKRNVIRIWSAATATGEEAFSIAFCILQELGTAALPRLNILATDISTRALSAALKGIYSAEKFGEIRPEELRAFLRKTTTHGTDFFLVKKEIRDAVAFRRLNLIEDFRPGAMYPLIFCRNVMIYFDRKTQLGLARRLAACLEPGGYLFIGHAETLNGFDVPLRYVQPAIYQKPA